MRVSTYQQFQSYTNNISEAQTRYLKIQNQLSSGKRIMNPSDDPSDTAMVVSLHTLRNAAERYTKNLQIGKNYLAFSETALDESHALVRRGYELAVRGANGATDQTSREGMIREVSELQRKLIELGNSRGPNGEFLFSGQLTNTKPFTFNVNTPVFNGDSNPITIEHAADESMQVNTQADQLYLDAWNRLESLKTNLSGGNTGAISGIDIAALQQSLDSFNQERGNIGAKMQYVESRIADHSRRIDEFSKSASELEEVDMAKAIVEYQAAEAAYSASLQVASKGFQLSLMDFIR